jgi:polysaccharide pyruvyl transferase WcaK-like protein
MSSLVGLNVNGLVYNGGYTRSNMFGLQLDYRQFLVKLASAVLGDPQTHLLLVPHTFAPDDSVESDPFACRQLREQLPAVMRNRVHVVAQDYDQNEIKGVIGLCDFFIGTRMHACIAALSQGKPTVGVAYSKKFAGVFDTVGMAQAVVDARHSTTEAALQKTLEIYAQRASLRFPLEQALSEARGTLLLVFQQMLVSASLKGETA